MGGSGWTPEPPSRVLEAQEADLKSPRIVSSDGSDAKRKSHHAHLSFRNSRLVVCLVLLAPGLSLIAEDKPAERVVPLRNAHAHNDYEHKRPLFDALDRGFCSVEADIFLSDNQLLVGHTKSDLKAERTLQKLYLDPLRTRIKENGGRVYRDGPAVFLLIDGVKDRS